MLNIEHRNYIKVPASIVYEVLTSSKGLGEIWTKKLDVQAKERYINIFDFDEVYLTKIKILRLEPNSTIVWECIASDEQWVGTGVSFELTEKDQITTVVLKHTNWRELTDFYQWCNYNWALFLQRLKIYCEKQHDF